MTPPSSLPIDPGLRSRFERAGAQIAWRPAEPLRPRAGAAARPTRSRIAHLHDEEARIEERKGKKGFALLVESGPVGALVILLEAGHRGPPLNIEGVEGTVEPRFPAGAIRASWGVPTSATRGTPVTVTDLVELARYALR
ncbi:MAG: hypothetical protein WA549_05955 [Thermoplasmata archaeon]